MAQIDSRIALGFQPQTQLENPVNQLAKILQVQNMQQEGQFNRLKMEDALTARDKQNRLTSLLSSEYAKPEDRENALMRGGFLNEARDLRKGRMEESKSAAEMEKTRLASAREKLTFLGQLAGGIKDQASYDQAKSLAAAQGIDVSSFPPQYDPAIIQNFQAQSMTALERMNQEWKQKGYDLDVRRQTETERNNQVQNSISRGQLGVSQANLGLRRQELELSQSAPKGQFIQTEQGYVLADPRTGTVQPVIGPDGKPLQGKAATKNLTEGQAKANLFGSRMVESDRILSELGNDYLPAAIGAKAAAEKTPLVGGLLGVGANALLGEKSQKAEQAQRDFINAVLRRESGAVIADSEFDNARKQYFPQPGDSKAVIEQKARNRQTAIQGMVAEIPGGLRSVPTLTNPGASSSPPAQGGFKILSVE